jgi:hypothetical protein
MTVLDRLYDNLRTHLIGANYGKVIILLGTRGSGKSETIKSLCRNLGGQKYIVHFDQELIPLPLHDDERNIYSRLPGCNIIENEDEFDWHPGIFVMEDFPFLSEEARQTLYNVIIDARHTRMNFLIVAHDYQVLRRTVFQHANAILLYRNAVISPQQLAPRVNGLSSGFAIHRALNVLPEHHYRFISFDERRWVNASIDSRDTRALSRLTRGLLSVDELSDITYPRRQNVANRVERETKRSRIESLIEEGRNSPEIARAVDTSPEYVWKVKCYMKKRYIANNNGQNIPHYLDDGRRNPE